MLRPFSHVLPLMGCSLQRSTFPAQLRNAVRPAAGAGQRRTRCGLEEAEDRFQDVSAREAMGFSRIHTREGSGFSDGFWTLQSSVLPQLPSAGRVVTSKFTVWKLPRFFTTAILRQPEFIHNPSSKPYGRVFPRPKQPVAVATYSFFPVKLLTASLADCAADPTA